TGLGRHRVHVAVGHSAPARPPEHADLAGEGEDRAPDQRDVEDLAGVGGEIAGGEVVGAVEHAVVPRELLEGAGGGGGAEHDPHEAARVLETLARGGGDRLRAATPATVNSTWWCRSGPSTVSGSKSVNSPTPAPVR